MLGEKLRQFYKGKKVLVTGHTGFKGAWMCKMLLELGADVAGFALQPPTDPSLFEICNLKELIHHVEGDIRDLESLRKLFDDFKPEIVIHMAAQPLVRESYRNPVYTYDVNVMGTVNVLECVRLTESVKSFLNVTTDKVYRNFEWERGYKEDDILNGYDPYSNSKSCSELVTSSYKNSFFGGESGRMENGRCVAISTCRAGNVLGGGDFADNRIIPDCVRAIEAGKEIIVRNPYSTRPYQHVLEPVTAYLMVAMEQMLDLTKAGNYNIGPGDAGCIATGDLVDLFCKKWNIYKAGEAKRKDEPDGGPHEANFLKLNSEKIHETFGWVSTLNMEETIDRVVEWTIPYLAGEDPTPVMETQIIQYIQNK